MAAVLSAIAGTVALFTLAIAFVWTDTAPFAIAATVALGAVALWGASRVDTRAVEARLDAVQRENTELTATVERIADTAWELRESEERYRSVIDAQGDLVARRDAGGRVTFVNPAFLATFGGNRDTVIGKPLSLVPLAEAPVRESGAQTGDIDARDLHVMTRGGPRWFAWVDIRVRDDAGALGPVYSVARDITARKEVELALVEAREKAEAASQAKSRFLATVSHEFRTPLNGILGLADLLLETRLAPVQESYARGIKTSGDALLALIDDLLDFSKIEAGRLDLRPLPTGLERLLQEIVELLAPRAHARGIDIAAEVDPAIPIEVSVDAARLRQVLVNLVGNGVKFTSRGGVLLAARLETLADGKATIAFAVTDSGPGIPQQDVERLFGEFEQADAGPSRQHGGAGLGLAISRRIVGRMGGALTFTPRDGGGSVFHFTLDLPAVAAPRSHDPTLAGRRVLVVMPDGAGPPAVEAALAEAGAEARSVTSVNAAAALIGAAVAADLAYDAVLVDRRLAEEAETTLSRLRDAAGDRVASAVLIAPGERGDVDALRQAGFDAYLVRPVRRDSLLRIVAGLVAEPDAFHMDPEDARPPTDDPRRQPGPSLDVLLAEDNEISALLARAVIEGLGHTVTEVRDGTAAVSAVTDRPEGFSLVLLDLHMPGLDGLEAARAIRRHEAGAQRNPTRIVALTADVLPETRAAATAAGIDATLEKPVSPESLRRLLLDITAPGEQPPGGQHCHQTV